MSSRKASPKQPAGRSDVSCIPNGSGLQEHRVDARASSKRCEPTAAMALNEPNLGSFADGKGEKGIDGSLERMGTLLYLGEEKSPLERGEQSNGEIVRVDVRRELSVGMKGSQPIADGGCPLIEPCRDERSGLGVTLGELTNERAKLAAPLCFGAPRCGDHHVPPGFDAVRFSEHLPIAIDDGLGLVIDDRLHKIVLVGKVVVHLRAADFRRHLDVFQGGARHPALMNQGGGAFHYSCPGACSLGGELRPFTRLVDHATNVSGILSLTTQY